MKEIEDSRLDEIAYEEVNGLTAQIEHHLSDYLDHEDLQDLKRWCFEYVEKKIRCFYCSGDILKYAKL